MFDSTTDFIHIFVNILTGWENKNHCKKAGFENSEDIHCQNSALKMTNGKKKVRIGVDILTKEFLILVSSSRTQCFRILPCLQQSSLAVGRI